MNTEQICYVLETEIVAGVFPPVTEDNVEYSIESYSALDVFVNVMNHPDPHVFSMVQSWLFQIKKRKKPLKIRLSNKNFSTGVQRIPNDTQIGRS